MATEMDLFKTPTEPSFFCWSGSVGNLFESGFLF